MLCCIGVPRVLRPSLRDRPPPLIALERHLGAGHAADIRAAGAHPEVHRQHILDQAREVRSPADQLTNLLL